MNRIDHPLRARVALHSSRLRQVAACALTLMVASGCGSDTEVATETASSDPFDVSAGLGNALSTAATYQVSASDSTVLPSGSTTCPDDAPARESGRTAPAV